MLTPHELARLFVIVDAPESADAASPELEALVEHELVQCITRTGESVELRLTPRGAQALARLAHGAIGSGESAGRARGT